MGLTAQEIANIAFTGAIQANGAVLSDAESQKAKALWEVIRQQFQGNELIENALNDLENQKSREILEQQIVSLLQWAMDKDDCFAQKLQNISTGDITGENANVVNSSGDRASFDLSRDKTEKQVNIQKDAIATVLQVEGQGNVVIFQTSSRQETKEETTITEIGANPYKGLSYFDEEDSDRYFGREAQIKKFWEEFGKIYQQDKLPRLLPILGPSGCGKSSLARAGLIPELVKRPLLGLKSWRVLIIKPGTRPLEALADVLAKAATDDPAPFIKKSEAFLEKLESQKSEQWDGLRRSADTLPQIDISPLIVLVDQFEEIYSLCEDVKERNAFIENLIHAASDRTKRVSVIFTLRSDFLAQTQKHQLLNQAIAKKDSNFIVPAMSKEELRDAIPQGSERSSARTSSRKSRTSFRFIHYRFIN